ncbi:hypothetical protein AVEN_104966-1 [Araneus ventricosus]|uniref:Uncharacterized protein n=1 Tax=Araneus ventricosus TaxID=182803 RepID=A0A4Y2SH86_ARAVE|nr:hypothetical protein AVEN_104966-1 [Araneus ventricosus]
MNCTKLLQRLNYSVPSHQNELHQSVTEWKLQCTLEPDLFQCDHPSRGPHIASCTQSFSTAKRNMPLGMLRTVRDVLEGRDTITIDFGLQIIPQENVA